MTAAVPAPESPIPAMGRFERGLSLWVVLCMAAGVLVGNVFPDVARTVAGLEVAQVNLPVGVLVWVMIVPMLMKVDFAALLGVRVHARGIAATLFVNWAVKPFSMVLLAWLFIDHVFASWLPPAEIDGYVAGLILLAAAPCTAMVFVWSQLCRGDAAFTLSQVALNDAIMVVAFGPLVALLLGLSSVHVPWTTLAMSAALYIVVPAIAAQLWRRRLLHRGVDRLRDVVSRLASFSIAALLLMLVVLFAFQDERILRQPIVIAMLAVPILIQVLLNSSLAYALNRKLGVQHCVAGPSALIGASNFFELAVATAISLFGLESGAALATVVGVLIEVPVMLAVVAVVNRSRAWYERGTAAA